ncbi:MAG: SDR family oxidoreductase [Myxococcales bacterium]|nr:SDR family oxidoreductase [Myxococcales bacterium]
MTVSLRDSRALVTGALGDIGSAIVKALASEGAVVVAAARDATSFDAHRGRFAPFEDTVFPVGANLTEPGQRDMLLDDSERAIGAPINTLVIAHGHRIPHGKIHSLDTGALEEALATDLIATMAIIQRAVPGMMASRFGRIVVIGSRLGQIGQPKSPINSMVKAALEGLVRNIAIDFGRYGITANVIAPGFVSGRRVRAQHPDHDEISRLEAAASTGRLVAPEEIGALCAFLCSARAGAITGTVIPIDGGLHLGHALRTP